MDSDIDFRQIVPRNGGRRDAFEELCCQLASRVTHEPVERLDGGGGDGGIECFFDAPHGRTGWQAKYLFYVKRLIPQANKSLNTAMGVHPSLTRFILCFPFDLTGPTARRGRSGIEKLKDWISEREESARLSGRQLTIEAWTASKIRSLLLEQDTSGGLRYFFFGTTSLSDDWFANHLKCAFETAGPRYTRKPNVETDLHKWMAAFGHEPSWECSFAANVSPLHSMAKQLEYTLHEPRDSGDGHPRWPDNTLKTTTSLVGHMRGVLEPLSRPSSIFSEGYARAVADLSELARELRNVEALLFRDIEDEHGPGRADSPGWRHFMAEYMVSFPAAHLDGVRNLAAAVETLAAWLQSPESSLAINHFFVLAGDPGIGKTHGICDAAARRHNVGLRTCIVFGHEFGSQPNPWSRVVESLGLAPSLGADQLLDCLNAAGEASRLPLLLCIDAINETKPLSYWRNYIASMASRVGARPYLRLCVVCRRTLLSHCLPDQHGFIVATHRGFVGIEREACQAYFTHFQIRPPIAPILQPELSNPLYLRLVCETLRACGIDRLPAGWSGGGTEIVRGFLGQKASLFSVHFESAREGTSTLCLVKVVKAIASSGGPSLPWATARALIASEVSDTDAALTWLVREGLLIEDVSEKEGWEQESVLRPAFERLGDFLVANELLNIIATVDLRAASQPDGLLHPWLKDLTAIQANQGVLSEFSVLVAERNPGLELPDLAYDPDTRDNLAQIAIAALVFRNPDSLTATTAMLIQNAFKKSDMAYDAMDAVLGCAWRISSIDAMWFHRFLAHFSMHERDAFWCHYLYDRFELGTVVKSFITAVEELPLGDIEPEIADRWVTVLLWFTAAADRRVKDNATRAATSMLAAATSTIPALVERFLDINDDEVRERALLCSYGALLLSTNAKVLQDTATLLYQRYVQTPLDFNNAVIRDHMRCICEMWIELSGDASQRIVSETITDSPASSDWPLDIPTNEDVEKWGESLRFTPDEMHSDFITYSMRYLDRWSRGLSQLDMGKWIAQRAARDFAYVDSRCEQYDRLMLQEYGGGRSKPVWAERIAKKYAWIGLYQLASRLHDHVEAHVEPWEKNRSKTPLILPEGRKLDPTIPPSSTRVPTNEKGWSIPRPKDLEASITSDLKDWVNDKAVPTLRDFAQPATRGERRLRPFLAYLSWDGAEKNAEPPNSYRQIWTHLQPYLVPTEQGKKAYEILRGRNLLGSLPRAIHFLRGFAGEYPWGTVFDMSEDEEEVSCGFLRDLPFSLVPAWSEVVCEWEYDASRKDATIHVPSRRLFDRSLRWDGNGGFGSETGDTVFVDPSFRADGPPALLVDVEFLNGRLKTQGLALILTLTGEKRVLAPGFGGRADLPRSTFCQVGYLDGDIQQLSKLRLFAD